MQNEHTRKMNRKLVTNHVRMLFEKIGRKCPKHIIYTRSPVEAQYVANYLDQGDFNALIKSHNYTDNYLWTKEAVKYCKRNNVEIKLVEDSNMIVMIGLYKRMQDVLTLYKYIDSIYLFNEVVIISCKPTKVIFDENGKLIFAKYRDGFVFSQE